MPLKAILILVAAILLVVACKSDDNTCEEDQVKEDWHAVTQNDSCSTEEKAEAYLALAGFSSYELINQGNRTIPEVLGLNSGNWSAKKTYADRAVTMVSSLSNGTQKTIYFFGSILGLYTTAMGNLDNGEYDPTNDATADAFDGELATSEIEAFTGSGLSLDASGDDGMSIVPVTGIFQVKKNGDDDYHLYDFSAHAAYVAYFADVANVPYLNPPSSAFVYLDINGDGTADGNHADSLTFVTDMSSDGLAEVNQIFRLNALIDPFENRNDLSSDIQNINGFANNIYDYLTRIEKGADLLGIDASEDYMEDIRNLKSNLDNGAQCNLLKSNPAISIFQYFISAFQDVSTDDYSTRNLIELSKLQELGSDETPDTTALTALFDITQIGARFRFRSGSDPNSYIPYWKEDSTSDIKDILALIERFQFNDVTSDDEKITFSEIMCISELMETSE